jgi:hypothetical protein
MAKSLILQNSRDDKDLKSAVLFWLSYNNKYILPQMLSFLL